MKTELRTNILGCTQVLVMSLSAICSTHTETMRKRVETRNPRQERHMTITLVGTSTPVQDTDTYFAALKNPRPGGGNHLL